MLPVITTIYSAGLEVLVPKGGMFPLEDTDWKLRLLLSSSGFLTPLNQEAEKGIMLLAGTTDTHYGGNWSTVL